MDLAEERTRIVERVDPHQVDPEPVEVDVRWVVRAEDGGVPLAGFRTKREAVGEARSQLAITGGMLRVHYGDGRIEYERRIQGSVPRPAGASSSAAVIRQIRSEGEQIDRWLESADNAVPAAGALLGAPFVAAMMSPEVQGALGRGWLAVFVATLAWSLGVALNTALVRKSGGMSTPVAATMVVVFAATQVIALILGIGALDLEFSAGNPWTVLLRITQAAFETYGPVGALLGAGLGYWLGYRATDLIPEDWV